MTDPLRIAKGLYWDRALSLVGGCTPVSSGCDNCWSCTETHMRAAQSNPKLQARYGGLTEGEKWNGQIRLHEDRLELPLRVKKPTVWAVWNDLFHDDVPFRFIHKVWDAMKACPQHTFLVLTKRPERMKEVVEYIYRLERFGHAIGFWKHVWLGVTAENQEQADKRIPLLLQIPAAVRWISVEPMLGEINLAGGGKTKDGKPRGGYYWLTKRPCPVCECEDSLGDERGSMSHPINCGWRKDSGAGNGGIDRVVCGSESGPNRRPAKLEWIRDLKNQCVEAGIPFFLKQAEIDGKLVKMPELDGLRWAQIPERSDNDG